MLTVFFRYFLTILTISGLFAGCAPIYAQEVNQPFITIQTDSVVVAENESIVALTLIIDNNNPLPFKGTIDLISPDGIRLLGKDNISLTIDRNSKIFYPIRLSVSKEVPAGESSLQLQLIDRDANIVAGFNSKLIIGSKRQVQLFNHRPNELMKQIGDSLTVSVML